MPRGGYKKTHFQADETTLNYVSKIGKTKNKIYDQKWIKQSIIPKITFNKNNIDPPYVCLFDELILQVLIKEYIGNNSGNVFNKILNYFNINENYYDFEVLSEKAISSGYIDLLIKRRHPIGKDHKIIIEVKKNKSRKKDIEQLTKYMEELEDCVGGILVANNFTKTCFKQISKTDKKILFIKYDFKNLDKTKDYVFQDLFNMLNLNIGYQLFL